MVHIGTKIPVPPRRDEKAWLALRNHIGQQHRDYAQAMYEGSVRRQHDLEQEIERLEAMPANPGRTKAIGLLRKALNAL